ncbi:MAG: helix-turn-helix transcriptional regulator [Dehalococcoides mccartyi]|uniref:helix-turn-helix domain-containing protein n=1 Tax=Dehalococcoides mccartyi TaxID=61435 RepID=UPI0030F92EB6
MDNLISFQQAKGLTDKELSEKLKISSSYFSRIKRGIRKPTIKFYSGVGRAFPELKPLIDAEIYGKTNYTHTEPITHKTFMTKFREVFK